MTPAGMVPRRGFEEQVQSAYPDDVDGLLIASTEYRRVGIIDALEQELGRPVLSANQASLWHCLRPYAPVTGYGSLHHPGDRLVP